MIDTEIMEGLKNAKKSNPNATIGTAIAEMIGVDGFYHSKTYSEKHIIEVSIPKECTYSMTQIAGIIALVNSMVKEGYIAILERDKFYGKVTDSSIMLRSSTEGAISQLHSCDFFDESKIWELLSSHYEITNI